MREALRERGGPLAVSERPPRIGLLLDGSPDPAGGKGYTAGPPNQNLAQALGEAGEIIAFERPYRFDEAAAEKAMAAYLEHSDVLWGAAGGIDADLALRVRERTGLDRPLVVVTGRSSPDELLAILRPWRRLLHPGDAIVFPCSADLKVWRRLTEDRTMAEAIIPFPLAEAAFRPAGPAHRLAQRRRLQLPVDAPLILHTGPLNVQENVHTLLDLLARVRRRCQAACLILAGSENDIALDEFQVSNTGYEPWLRRLASDWGLEHAVVFLGPLAGDELAGVRACADVVVNLGFRHHQTAGLAQAEALACGVPVVSSDWGGARDVVPHDTGGYRVAAVLTGQGVRIDVAEASARVADILSDPGLRARLGQGAAAWAAGHFSIEAAARSAVALTRHLLATRRPSEGRAFELSELAFRYQLHRRACGWPDLSGALDGPGLVPGPLFQGNDYRLYQEVFGSYPTRLTGAAGPEAIQPDQVPHLGPFVHLDHDRRLASDEDPIWPHRRFFGPAIWEVVTGVDGQASVAEIAEHAGTGLYYAQAAIWRLEAEGFALVTGTGCLLG